MSIPSDNYFLIWATSVAQEPLIAATPVPCNEINQVFQLMFDSKTLFLKIGPNLQREYDKLQWLHHHQPAPVPYGFIRYEQNDALLTSAIPGKGLSRLTESLPPATIITRLAVALKVLHATPIADWPFDRSENGTVLVHGDACLPNIMYCDGRLSGYIDVGDMQVDAPEVDLAAAIWSLQYNLGPGYGLAFLHEYGVSDANEEDVERLRLMYETG